MKKVVKVATLKLKRDDSYSKLYLPYSCLGDRCFVKKANEECVRIAEVDEICCNEHGYLEYTYRVAQSDNVVYVPKQKHQNYAISQCIDDLKVLTNWDIEHGHGSKDVDNRHFYLKEVLKDKYPRLNDGHFSFSNWCLAYSCDFSVEGWFIYKGAVVKRWASMLLTIGNDGISVSIPSLDGVDGYCKMYYTQKEAMAAFKPEIIGFDECEYEDNVTEEIEVSVKLTQKELDTIIEIFPKIKIS